MTRPQIRRAKSPYPEIVDRRKRAFLTAFQQTGNVLNACQIAHVGQSSHYRWLKEDTAYREAVEIAKQVAGDVLESEAWRRAVEGVEKPVGWYQGEPDRQVASMGTCC